MKHAILQFAFWRDFYNRFIDDVCLYRAAALAFTTIMSIVPLMAVSVSILTAFPAFEQIGSKIQDFVFKHFVASSGHVIQEYLQVILKHIASLSLINLLFLMTFAVMLIFTMEQTLNQVWRVKKQRQRWHAFLTYWGLLTLLPLILAASFLASTQLFSKFETFLQPIAFFGPYLLLWLLLWLLYVGLPNRRVNMVIGMQSALLITILYAIMKYGFVAYVEHFSNYQMLYGALSVIPLFFLWVYLFWVLILLGAEFCYALNYAARYQHVEKLDGFTQAYRWLWHFWKAQTKGEALSLERLIEVDGYNYEVSPEAQLAVMLQARLLIAVGSDRYLLARHLSELTIADLWFILPWRLPLPEKLPNVAWAMPLKKLSEHHIGLLKKTGELSLVEIYQMH